VTTRTLELLARIWLAAVGLALTGGMAYGLVVSPGFRIALAVVSAVYAFGWLTMASAIFLVRRRLARAEEDRRGRGDHA
jgi:hypothetical protein